ncbi:MAG: endonuclease V, partial [Thiogranum sp.]
MPYSHPWPVTVAAARLIQEALAPRVIRKGKLGKVKRVAGVDVGFEGNGRTTRAAVAVLSFPDLEPVDQAIYRCPT